MEKICRDCGQPIEEIGSNKSGICKACYTRKSNMKHRGQTYVRVLDLPEEERERILRFRQRNSLNGKKKREKREKNNLLKEKIIKNNNQIKAQEEKQQIENKKDDVLLSELNRDKDLVLADIKNSLKNSGLDFPEDFTSLVPIYNQLNTIFNNYEKYINNMLNVEEIIHKMEIDYRHAKEHYSSLLINNPSNFNDIYIKREIWEHRHNILLDFRRKVKNVLSEYNSAGSFFIELLKNKDLMDNFKDCYKNLMDLNNILNDGNYKARASSLVEAEDFCIGYKTDNFNNKEKYRVDIKTLYNGNTSFFTRTVVALSKEDAKQQVIEFIKSDPNKFRFTWKDEDVTITKIDTDNDLPRQ